jgi:pSer/pThr/pTyr-binding forkhead associated (FHA) protein
VWNDRVLPLNEGENVIGRDPSCSVWLDQPGVSRRHARVVVTADRAEIEDLGSTNGTFVSETALTGRRQLRDEDVIQLGSVDLKYRSWSPSRPVETERITRGK